MNAPSKPGDLLAQARAALPADAKPWQVMDELSRRLPPIRRYHSGGLPMTCMAMALADREARRPAVQS